ncbi:MAG: imelysin family protein, partial [Paracoccaceae bacterium]
MRFALILPFLALPAFADVNRTLEHHILPGHITLGAATAELASTAKADCTPDAVRPAFHTAFDAWIGISHIHFGPLEDQALTLAMSFW